MGLDDRTLTARLVAGDHSAVTEVFDRYAPLLHRVARRWTGHEQDAEDVVSATFLTVWQRRQDAHTVEGSLRPWLLTIATNLARNALRARRRRTLGLIRLTGQDCQHVAPTPQDRVLDQMDAERDAAVVSAGIERLPRRERDVAVLCLLEGLQIREAAHVLGVAEGTVRSRLFRARTSLKALLRSGEATERGHGRGHLPSDRPAPAGDQPTGARR